MCYRCEICSDVVAHGHPQRRWTVRRPNGQTARELRVCDECLDDLQSGVNLSIMLEEHRKTRESARQLAEAQKREAVEVPQPKPVNVGEVLQEPGQGTPLRDMLACQVCSRPIGPDGMVTGSAILCKAHSGQAGKLNTRTGKPTNNGQRVVSNNKNYGKPMVAAVKQDQPETNPRPKREADTSAALKRVTRRTSRGKKRGKDGE